MRLKCKISFYWCALCWMYWVYLWQASVPLILDDAKGYAHLGQFINSHGWGVYFSGEVKRELLYPAFIAGVMRLADLIAVPYLKLLIFIQLILLGFSQWGVYRLLQSVSVRPGICLGLALYFGFSPAMLNAALSMYSEILVIPLVVIALNMTASFIHQRQVLALPAAWGKGFVVGSIWLLAALVKGVFEVIIPVTAVLCLLLLYINGDKNFLKKAGVFTLGLLLFFESGVLTIKYLNLSGNGNFSFTDRGSWALYGNTIRRTETINARRILAAAAYVPGEGVCRRLFNTEDCHVWSSNHSDTLSMPKYSKMIDSGLPQKEVDRWMMVESVKAAASQPLTYGLFYCLEMIKLFFWESTQVGFVRYPSWLDAIYGSGLFKDLLRLLVSLLGFLSFVIVLVQWLRKKFIPEQQVVLGFLIVIIFAYMGIHGFFYVLTRYAFAIVPLWIVFIGCALSTLFGKKA